MRRTYHAPPPFQRPSSSSRPQSNTKAQHRLPPHSNTSHGRDYYSPISAKIEIHRKQQQHVDQHCSYEDIILGAPRPVSASRLSFNHTPSEMELLQGQGGQGGGKKQERRPQSSSFRPPSSHRVSKYPSHSQKQSPRRLRLQLTERDERDEAQDMRYFLEQQQQEQEQGVVLAIR